MIRVLHVIGAMNRAGAETMIMNLYRAINRNEIQFDFLVHTDKRCDYDDEIQSLGGAVYRLPRFIGVNCLSYRKGCDRFFANHPEIDIVHGHIGVGAPIYLAAANAAGKFTIAHAHSENFYTGLNRIAFSLFTHPTRKIAQSLFACSEQACIDTFGYSALQDGHCRIINNGVDTEAFRNGMAKRKVYRNNLGLDGHVVFGHIGRFIPVKNHEFLIKVFAEILRRSPDAQLLLIGDGPNRPQIENEIKSSQLEKSVRLLGVREDIPELLAAMDVFVFPSKKEGLPVSVVEAQAAGLPVLLSDGVTKAAEILPSAERTSLSEGAAAWANRALSMLNSRISPTDAQAELKAAGFDVAQNAQALSHFYAEAHRGK